MDKQSYFFPVVWGRFLYNAAMGLGYRPFRLVWWVLTIILGFTIWYLLRIKEQINRYFYKDEKKELLTARKKRSLKRTGSPHSVDLFIKCFYFSTMIFFTLRLKKDLLTFFDKKEQWVVVGEWLVGILIYISFLTFSKSGSILHTLKSLFLG